MKNRGENKYFLFRLTKSQVSIEYLLIVGFVTFGIIGILGISLIYSGGINDRIKIAQINNFGNKITSTAESIFYAGEPSKITISVYLPDNVKNIEISGNELFITFDTHTGENLQSFTSKVPLFGNLGITPGLKNIEFKAEADRVVVS